MNQTESKVGVITAIVFTILGFLLLIFAVFFLPDVNFSANEGDELYISGRIKLEENDNLTFKSDDTGKIYTYVTYVNKFDEILVKKIIIETVEDLSYDFKDQDHSTFNYRVNRVDGSINESELYIVIGHDLAGRIRGVKIE